MRLHVPLLEFVHLLNREGIEMDAVGASGRAPDLWARLGEERQDAFLRERGVAGAARDVKGVHVEKRRRQAPTAASLVVVMDVEGPRTLWGDARERLARAGYEPFRAQDAAALAGPSPFRRGPGTPGRFDALTLLDTAWGGEPYDAARDGPLCEPRLAPEEREVERYWLAEPFSMALLVEDAEPSLRYRVVEPRLTGLEEALLATLNARLRDVLLLEPRADGSEAAILLERLLGLLRMYRFRTDRRSAYKLGYYFVRNYLGLGRVEPLMRDPHVEDVSCNGPGMPLFVAHSRHQSVRTDVAFDEAELNAFTMKLAQRGGKLLSLAQPIADASLPDGSRVQACFGREITSRGSAFTVRKFREDPLTCVDLVRTGAHSADTMAVLWLAVEMRRSLLVMGATASGKTTTLNCVGQFVPPTAKVVSIEDTRELTLQHENWLAALTREAFSGGREESVGMFDLLRAALRQRPDYIVVGEIRGAEGLTLFQAMSTGHTCFSTMHAGSVENAVYRLENPPIGVPRVMLSGLDFFLLQGQVDLRGQPARRMLSLTEVNGLDPQTRNLRVHEVWRWDPAHDRHEAVGTSEVLERARGRMGWTRTRLDEELTMRRRVLERLAHDGERHYGRVSQAIRAFYAQRRADGWEPPTADPSPTAIAPQPNGPLPPMSLGRAELAG